MYICKQDKELLCKFVVGLKDLELHNRSPTTQQEGAILYTVSSYLAKYMRKRAVKGKCPIDPWKGPHTRAERAATSPVFNVLDQIFEAMGPYIRVQ